MGLRMKKIRLNLVLITYLISIFLITQVVLLKMFTKDMSKNNVTSIPMTFSINNLTALLFGIGISSEFCSVFIKLVKPPQGLHYFYNRSEQNCHIVCFKI